MALTQISTDGIKNGTITGSDLATNVDLVDNQKIRFGTGNDLQIFHSGATAYILNNTGTLFALTDTFEIRGSNANETHLKTIDNGAVELYHDNTKKFETLTDGVSIPNDNDKLKIGASQDLYLWHNGSTGNSNISNVTGDLFIQGNNGSGTAVNQIAIKSNAAVELNYQGTKKFETTSIGAKVTGHLNLGNELNMTEGIAATRSIDAFVGDAGTFRIRGTNSGDSSGHQVLAEFRRNAGVHLNHSGSTKLETTSTGINISASVPTITLSDTDGNTPYSRITAGGGDLIFEADQGDEEANTLMLFRVDDSEKMRIDSSGNVGINETSPETTLHVENDNAHSSTFYLNSDATILAANKNTSGTRKTVLKLESDAAIVYGGPGGTLIFSDRQSERMRILSNGRIGFATASTTGLGSQTGAANVCTFNFAGVTLTQYGVTAGFYYDRLNFTNSQYFIVNSSGTGVYLGNGSTSFTAHSDERLKENITELDGIKAYNHVKTARAASFKWKATGYPTDTKIGFIAQDWETNYPEVTNSTTETIDEVKNPKGIQYTETIPVLMAALKQAIIKIETLETEVAALKAS